MPDAWFRFDESWSVSAPLAEVAEVVADLAGYPDWWPQVLAVATAGQDRARVLCRSRLPYTLDLVLTRRWQEASVLEVEVAGDLTGWVRVTMSPHEGRTTVHFEQEVWVDGVLAWAARFTRGLLVWNHRQMMRGFRDGLGQRLTSRGDPA